MAAKTIWKTWPAPQATEQPEHLDLRSHRPQKIPPLTWLFVEQWRFAVGWCPPQQLLSFNLLV